MITDVSISSEFLTLNCWSINSICRLVLAAHRLWRCGKCFTEVWDPPSTPTKDIMLPPLSPLHIYILTYTLGKCTMYQEATGSECNGCRARWLVAICCHSLSWTSKTFVRQWRDVSGWREDRIAFSRLSYFWAVHNVYKNVTIIRVLNFKIEINCGIISEEYISVRKFACF